MELELTGCYHKNAMGVSLVLYQSVTTSNLKIPLRELQVYGGHGKAGELPTLVARDVGQ